MPTVVGKGNGAQLVCAMLTKHYGGVVGTRLDQGLGTISGRDSQAITCAGLGEATGTEGTDRVAAFLTKYYGTGGSLPMNGPLHTVTSRDRFAMVTVRIDGSDWALVDIGMRMLQPHELAAAQGFPSDYILTGTKTAQVHRIGNSVPPPVVRALVEAQTA
jgi:DNA (cytosine-5)-methyltransferase 1